MITVRKKKSIINFWGIGAQKSGTSWLFYNLGRLPDFDLPPIRELHYFDQGKKYPSPDFLFQTRLIDRMKNKAYLREAIERIASSIGKGRIKDTRFYLKWYGADYNDNWYLSLFRHFKGITGEITPSYSMLKKVDIQKMYALSPDAKLILMLRNPIDRAWSHYRHIKKKISTSLQKVSL